MKRVSMIASAQNADIEIHKIEEEADAQNPIRLFLKDASVLFVNLGYLIYAFIPLRLASGLPGVEYNKARLTWEYIYIALLSILQAIVLVSLLPLWFIVPGLLFLIVLGVVLAVFFGLSALLWGSLVVESRYELDNACKKKFQRERWMFINGVATSHYMLQASCDMLSATFRRPITGVHNRTYGIVGDIIECLMQRSLRYMGQDTRRICSYLRAALLDDGNIDKVVVIAHSQGGIILSLALDRLYATMPSSHFSKLEVYTFGSAASFFHNPPIVPHGKLGEAFNRSHSLPLDVAETALKIATAIETKDPDKENMQFQGRSRSSKSRDVNQPAKVIQAAQELVVTKDNRTALPDKYIHTVEHYCNSMDIVPRWGVLFGVARNTPLAYSGRAFVHEGATGHLFDQHYLETMFPLAELGQIRRKHDGGNAKVFLNHHVQVVSKLEKQTLLRAKTFAPGRIRTGTDVTEHDTGKEVKDWSRLWQYMDGGVGRGEVRVPSTSLQR